MCRIQGVPDPRLHSNMPVMDTLSDRPSIMAETKLGGEESRA